MAARARIAILTYSRFPNLWHEDRRLVAAFADLGLHAEPVVWSNGSVEWRSYDAVVVRSCWDYYLDYSEFLTLLDGFDALGLRVFNSTDVIRWNTDKRYLLELLAAGAAAIPTEVAALTSLADLTSLAESRGWDRVVVKPTISANGHETHLASIPTEPEQRPGLEALFTIGPVIVQPFAPEIVSTGEYSLIFIDGTFSHALLKRPGSTEFRVQADYGGTAEPISAPLWMIQQAAQALAASGRPSLYARVDGIARNDRFLLMELELTEPNLYFEFAPDAAARLAGAVARELRGC